MNKKTFKSFFTPIISASLAFSLASAAKGEENFQPGKPITNDGTIIKDIKDATQLTKVEDGENKGKAGIYVNALSEMTTNGIDVQGANTFGDLSDTSESVYGIYMGGKKCNF